MDGIRDSLAGANGVIAHGFDIKDNAENMQAWYLSKARNA